MLALLVSEIAEFLGHYLAFECLLEFSVSLPIVPTS